jgi:hypothetical protein
MVEITDLHEEIIVLHEEKILPHGENMGLRGEDARNKIIDHRGTEILDTTVEGVGQIDLMDPVGEDSGEEGSMQVDSDKDGIENEARRLNDLVQTRI